ncbi:thioesterase II family protein [Amycolatopsis roodepoortensis]|uniref:Surfactin synthase thioesterase subunit n=1 Tax=Amycolatopsis roodepoortensis TaxID=700274 RepID=A0ABR9LIT4_9PSEU|nr:thioesterase [Amycolatopsis roodepoortensis]MBE1580093.1 surfactin synthase thioesterase subunit [Amycolatopsis roodepoortensis]
MSPTIPEPRNPEHGTSRRLYAFHHAGGGASTYLGWRRPLGPSVEIVPVVLPSGPDRTLDGVVESVVRALDHSRPYLFYGHSMGARIAFRVACSLLSRGLPGPDRLIVGASAAPSLPAGLDHVVRQDDGQLMESLLALDPESVRLLGNSRLAGRALRSLRADLALCAEAAAVDTMVLSRPIDVFAGVADPIVPLSGAAAWARHTTAGFRLHRVDGGHFFHRRPAGDFLAGIRRLCAEESLFA